MRLEVVRTVFRKELREMLRDRRSLAVMFGLPLLLYPLIAIGIASLGSSRQRELTERPAAVAVTNIKSAPGLQRLLQEGGSGVALAEVSDPAAALRANQIDAVVEVPPAAERDALAGRAVAIRTRLDRSRTSANFAERKIGAVLKKYEQWVIEQRLARRGVPATVLKTLDLETIDVASRQARFGHMLAQMLPLLLMMTGMLGALFPALNATTTERELGTLETLLVTPAGRTELLVAKGALVLVCGLLTAGLNMVSMSLVLKRSLSMLDAEAAKELSVSGGALALAFLAAVPTLVFFTTIVLIVGLMARNFREANAFATPVMLLPLASLAVGIMEPVATPGLLVTPVANTTVIIRDVLTGQATGQAFLLAFASSAVYAGLMLSVAARLFSNEQLVNPSWEPLTLKGFRRGKPGAARRKLRLPDIDEAVALFALVLVLFFYIPVSFIRYGFIVIVIVNQLLLVLAPTLLLALLARWQWGETFSLRRASPALLLGAAMIGVGLVPWVQLFAGVQHLVWPKQADEGSRLQAELLIDALTAHPLLTIGLTALLAGVCEELMFRGPIQRALTRRLPAGVAILLTALLFAGLHLDLHGLAIRTALGVILGWLVWRGGSIFPAMLLHGLYDATALTVATLELRRAGAEQLLTEEVAPKLQFDTTTLLTLGAGAALLMTGGLLCRVAFNRRTHPEPVALPA